MTLKELMPFGKKDVPVRRNGESPFTRLQREMDEFFESFARGFDMEPFFGRRSGSFSPNVDVTENDKEIKISAELPGMDDKDIDVTLDGDSLTIKGEKKDEKEEKGRDYYRMERSYGSFSRTIPIPVEVETEKARASFKKGLLTVTIPKTARAIESKRKIQINAE
ncbi:spore protein SP21 [bacterium BMS3Abin07]|nr:spore protein SP21 [bacterium BMS3Abin07]GBE32413.1 spore protein SP21 [bacterium BMS3Bbin05]HDO23352.1 Hsp20/alpha crystallin family protein [Nitrospirota bacterium]HDZ88997.1 Hsp20/alpha crystallin family protein [Nitrospirota bacterium]